MHIAYPHSDLSPEDLHTITGALMMEAAHRAHPAQTATGPSISQNTVRPKKPLAAFTRPRGLVEFFSPETLSAEAAPAAADENWIESVDKEDERREDSPEEARAALEQHHSISMKGTVKNHWIRLNGGGSRSISTTWV